MVRNNFQSIDAIGMYSFEEDLKSMTCRLSNVIKNNYMKEESIWLAVTWSCGPNNKQYVIELIVKVSLVLVKEYISEDFWKFWPTVILMQRRGGCTRRFFKSWWKGLGTISIHFFLMHFHFLPPHFFWVGSLSQSNNLKEKIYGKSNIRVSLKTRLY